MTGDELCNKHSNSENIILKVKNRYLVKFITFIHTGTGFAPYNTIKFNWQGRSDGDGSSREFEWLSFDLRQNTLPSISFGFHNKTGIEALFFVRSLEMAKKPSNSGKPWTVSQVAQLKVLVRQNTPTRVIGLKLKRTPEAIYAEASKKGISLKPTNQSPYNRRK